MKPERKRTLLLAASALSTGAAIVACSGHDAAYGDVMGPPPGTTIGDAAPGPVLGVTAGEAGPDGEVVTTGTTVQDAGPDHIVVGTTINDAGQD
jgi:hypothetical protein